MNYEADYLAIWPENGLEILQQIRPETIQLRADLIGRQGISDGSGTADASIFQAANWCLKTSARRSYQTVIDGQMALNKLAEKKLLLGDLLSPNSVLYLQDCHNGKCQLWTISPWVTTLRNAMAESCHIDNQESLSYYLQLFAQAIIATICLAADREIILDVHPSNFAFNDKQKGISEIDNLRLCYIDDDIVYGNRLPLIGYAILRRFEEYERWPMALNAYQDKLTELIKDRLNRQIVTQLELTRVFINLPVRSERARTLGLYFTDLLERC